MVKDLLKEGAGSVPNRKRLFVEVEWKYTYIVHPSHHFLRFSKFSLEKALNFAEFKGVEIYELDFLHRTFLVF